MIYDITTGQQSVTATGPVTGSLDTSALLLPCTIYVEISGLAAGQVAAIVIEDTAGSTPFSDAATVATFTATGQIQPASDVTQSIESFRVPALRFGATHNKLRANVTEIDGGTLTLHAYLEL